VVLVIIQIDEQPQLLDPEERFDGRLVKKANPASRKLDSLVLRSDGEGTYLHQFVV
jgi:hypothetical protein